MSKEGLVLTKGGKLIETNWELNGTFDEEGDENYGYATKDVTDIAITKMFDVCVLEEGVTLRDIFLLLDSNLELFDLLLQNWTKDLVREGLDKPAKAVGIYDSDGIEYLELVHTLHSDASNKEIHGLAFPDLHGVGWLLQEDKLDDWNNDDGTPHVQWQKGERIPWGVSFTPTNELIDLPVKLASELTVYDDDLNSDTWHNKLATYEGVAFTLGHILYGIVWELSWHGGPASRDKLGTELKEAVKGIKDGTVETAPYNPGEKGD